MEEAAVESTPVPVDTSKPTFADFYRATFPEMTRLAFLLTGSAETARDLVQDSFVRLHDKWHGVAEPRAYLRRTVVNACHAHHRRLRLQRRHVDGDPETATEFFLDFLDFQDVGDITLSVP